MSRWHDILTDAEMQRYREAFLEREKHPEDSPEWDALAEEMMDLAWRMSKEQNAHVRRWHRHVNAMRELGQAVEEP